MIKLYKKKLGFLFLICLIIPTTAAFSSNQSVARKWNEAMLFSIRRDYARPTIHARNIFHVSIAMYDAWAVFDSTASTYFLGQTIGTFTCPFNGIVTPDNIREAQEKAISYASYRILRQRFQYSPGATYSLLYYDSLMNDFGYPIDFYSQDYSNGDPAALGNYIAAKIIEFGFLDGSNQQNNYVNQYYQTVNSQIIVNNPGNPIFEDPNRWQAIFLDEFIDQSGNVISISPPFLSPEWGNVVPFSLNDSHKSTFHRDGHDYPVYLDQSAPPYIDTTQLSDIEDPYKWGFLMVGVWQSHLDPSDDVMWDISPASIGNNPALPSSISEYPSFYNFVDGGDQSQGRNLNPKTGLPYEPQLVKRGDYTRVLAEFWADGPDSEAPPGHWQTILNYVSDHPLFEKRWNGEGPILSDLAWDVKSHLTLAGGMHDAAICAWSSKGYYDYPRPVSTIRWMAEKGQSTDPNLPRFHNAGIPLISGLVEMVMPGDPLIGDNNENLHKIKINTWKGHDFIANPEIDVAGVDWILAEKWWPYQRPSFVTPPFGGYISGHSAFSRTAAEIMKDITGDPFFPGGMGEFHAGQNTFLQFEEGPSQDIVLQWATYEDASDQCSLSRIWGGIHPPQDDIPGRKIGIELGPIVCERANSFMLASKPFVSDVQFNSMHINDNSVAEGFDITLTFNEEMNTSLTPLIEFSNPEVLNTLISEQVTWLNSSICKVHYTIQDNNADINHIHLKVSLAKDTSNEEQKIFILQNAFDIRMKNPSITASSSNILEINVEAAQNQALNVNVVFDEPMDMNQQLLINVDAGPEGTGLTLNENESGWVNNTNYQFVWDLLNVEEECPIVEIAFHGAKDLDGNVISNTSLNQTITIDTKTPFLYLITANTYEISPINTSEELQIITVFSEPMDQSVRPILEFIANPNVSDILQLNTFESDWLNGYTYLLKYSILPLEINVEEIGIKLSGGKDLIGNEMFPDTLNNFFQIHLNPTYISIIPTKNNSELRPNPVVTGNNATLKLTDIKSIRSIDILSNTGKIVSTLANSGKNELAFSTADLAAGVYYIRIIKDSRTEMLQLVVVQ